MITNQHSTYQCFDSDSNNAVAAWSFVAIKKCVTRVVPDGCRDIIITQESAPTPQNWFVSELSTSIYEVHSNAGDKMRGLRLAPATQLNTLALYRWLESHRIDELFNGDQLDEFCQRSTSVSEALQCLADKEIVNIKAAANKLGVSERTLQRVVKLETQRSPYFWLSLARVRRAVKSLDKLDSLADVASACQYSDQAHMTRNMQLWLGMPPSQIKNDGELLALLNEPGFA